ncbi:hypothetical protein EYF80_032359 [Liparis tanakae]|uniref:Uncharacterized protein n=1 Tax=Liparis tanakae TaxID=230148 RepID=A0A4Z2GVY6_9TELE|nr:hypothetical protein EYF80_032359 [Liparis tanakae]
MKACTASRRKHPSQLFSHNKETNMAKMNGFQKTDFKRIRATASHWKSRFYKDQCISSKSTESPVFVSVSRRLMNTAMAASSLPRLLRPGPTTLSKSSWEFSSEAR